MQIDFKVVVNGVPVIGWNEESEKGNIWSAKIVTAKGKTNFSGNIFVPGIGALEIEAGEPTKEEGDESGEMVGGTVWVKGLDGMHVGVKQEPGEPK